MRKFGVLVIIFLMFAGCSRQSNDVNNEENDLNEMRKLLTDSEQFELEVEELLEPLLEGIYLENKMIQGAAYIDGMTIEDLRIFLLQYYTEELADETCELIIYKSELGYGTEHSGMFTYDQETDIFYLEGSRELEDLPEDAKITIDEIVLKTEDRIEIIVITNWELLKNNSIKTRGENGFIVHSNNVYITLEKEGDHWYLGDLVFSRTTINEANREYRGQ